MRYHAHPDTSDSVIVDEGKNFFYNCLLVKIANFLCLKVTSSFSTTLKYLKMELILINFV